MEQGPPIRGKIGEPRPAGLGLDPRQKSAMRDLTWPGMHGVTASHMDVVQYVNGVRIIVYPNGKLDILTVSDTPSAREAEAKIREKFGDKILGHVRTYRYVYEA